MLLSESAASRSHLDFNAHFKKPPWIIFFLSGQLKKQTLTEAACSPEGYTSAGWASASCWRHRNLDGSFLCLPSSDTHTWSAGSLRRTEMLDIIQTVKATNRTFKHSHRNLVFIFLHSLNISGLVCIHCPKPESNIFIPIVGAVASTNQDFMQ